MLPKAGRSCRRIVSSLRLLYPLAAVTGFPNNPCRGRICPARRLPLPSFSVSGILHKQKALLKSEQGLKRSRHLPIFTGRFQPTIFGTSELNFCVRNGNRWNLTVIDTGQRVTFVMLLFLFRITLSCYPVKGCTLKTEYRTAFLANRVSDQDGVKPSTY